MRRRTTLIAAGVVCHIAAALLTASASAAPCPPGTPAAFSIKAPATVAVGRKFTAEFSSTSSEGWSATAGEGLLAPAALSFAPVSPGAHLSGAFTTSTTRSYTTSPPIRFKRGDEAGRLSASWTQSRGTQGSKYAPYEECEASTSAIVTPIRGELTQVQATIVHEFGDSDFRLVMPCRSRDGDITQASTAPLKFEFRGAGARRHFSLSDVCEYTSTGTLKTRNWWIPAGENARGAQTLTLELFSIARKPVVMHFQVSQASELLASGHFKVRTRYKPSRTIFEGSDAFINYCIDHTRTLHSHHGRLYCVYPGYLREIAFDLHWRDVRRQNGSKDRQRHP